jgi:hypothetical protein
MSGSRQLVCINVFCACGRGHLQQHVEPSVKMQLVLRIQTVTADSYTFSLRCESSTPD